MCLDGPFMVGFGLMGQVLLKKTPRCWTDLDAHTKIFTCVNSICLLSILISPPVYKVMIL